MTGFSWHEDNPYVQNIYYFSNVTNLDFKQTEMGKFLFFNWLAAFIMGILCISLVTYLVLFKTPMHFRPYTKVLMICLVADTYYLFGDLLCQTRFRIVDGAMLIHMSGPVSHLPYYGQCISLALQTTGPMFSTCTVSIQYFIRYYTIKENRPPRFQLILGCLSVAIILSSFLIYTTPNSFCTLDNYEKVDYGRKWYPEMPIPQLLVSHQYFNPLIFHLSYISLVMSLSYTLAMVLARLTISELDRQSMGLSLKNKSLHKQLALTLFAQSISPLFTAIFPVVFAIIAMPLNIGIGHVGDFVLVAINWFPFLNSLSTIIFIVPYRRHCLRFCGWRLVIKRKVTTANNSAVPVINSPIQPISNNNSAIGRAQSGVSRVERSIARIE